MTSQNPASSQSSKLDRDILAKVNAHADRSIDRVFADIDELLSGDLEADTRSSSVERYSPRSQYSAEPSRSTNYTVRQLPQSDFTPTPISVELDPAPPATTQQKKRGIPLWLKALLGVGATSIAAGSVLLWLVNERKVELPKNIDTSWLPFQSQSQVSPSDAKFAEYMRKSISKIESTNTQTTSATNLPNSIATPISQATTITANPSGLITTAPSTATPTVVKTPIALVKTLQNSDRPSAVFQIDRQSQTIRVGQKIGTSNWSLLTVAKGEVIVKRKGGEIRSISVGQKF
jgi:hypothetical protein